MDFNFLKKIKKNLILIKNKILQDKFQINSTVIKDQVKILKIQLPNNYKYRKIKDFLRITKSLKILGLPKEFRGFYRQKHLKNMRKKIWEIILNSKMIQLFFNHKQ